VYTSYNAYNGSSKKIKISLAVIQLRLIKKKKMPQ